MGNATSISQLYRTAKCLEAIENYALVDEPLQWNLQLGSPLEAPGSEQGAMNYGKYFDKNVDEGFWTELLGIESARPNENLTPAHSWDQQFTFYGVALSEWVPRVPGLFWTPYSKSLRRGAAQYIEYRTPNRVTYYPLGKSMRVLGGIGTVKLPPDPWGRHLVCLSSGANASSGIPAIIYPDVWDQHSLREGVVLHQVTGRWRQMDSTWAERFPSIKGIPKGYLVIASGDQIRLWSDTAVPISVHPFSVMQYSRGNSILFDYIYVTVDTTQSSFRPTVIRFFEEYSQRNERYGEYLLSADVSEPLWNAQFDSPAALRQSVPGAGSLLNLIVARIKGSTFAGSQLDTILEFLVSHYDLSGLLRLSAYIGIPSSLWYSGSSLAHLGAGLLDLCNVRGKVEELMDAMAQDYPELLRMEEARL